MSLAIVLALAAGGPPGDAMADAAIRWEAPPSCPSPEAFQQRLTIARGAAPLRTDVSVLARVDRRELGGFGLEITLRTLAGSSTRYAEAADCGLLADAAALIVATFVQPLAVIEQLDTSTSSASSMAPHTQPAAPPADSAPVLKSAARPPSRSGAERPALNRWSVALGGLAGQATLPGVDLGAALALGWGRGRLLLEASAMALGPRRRVLDPVSETRLRLWMAGGELRASAVLPISSRLELPIGLGLELGAIVARGEGVSRPRTVLRPWVAAVGSVQLLFRATARWGFWGGVSTVAGLVRPAFTVSDQGPAVAGPGGLRGAVGVQWRSAP